MTTLHWQVFPGWHLLRTCQTRRQAQRGPLPDILSPSPRPHVTFKTLTRGGRAMPSEYLGSGFMSKICILSPLAGSQTHTPFEAVHTQDWGSETSRPLPLWFSPTG